MILNFEKPKALITGASSGIGKALYENMKEDERFSHLRVVGLSRRGPDIKYNLRDLVYMSVVDTPIPSLLEGVSILINCAGIMPDEEVDKTTGEIVMDINFWATYRLIMNLLPKMNKGAHIINIASISGLSGESYFPVYAASKAAVISLTKSLAVREDFIEKKIRINTISPGIVDTNLFEGETPSEMIDSVPIGYQASPHDLYPVVTGIIDCGYINGANIVVDGGVTR